jgi:alpha-N-arabinofuranosidase
MSLLTLATSVMGAQPGAVSVLVTVDTSKSGPQIKRELYGQFIEHLGTQIYDGIWVGEGSPIPNVHGFRKDVVEAVKKLDVPVLRWPGGCFADQYNWRDGIGPREKRPARLNAQYGGTVDSNAFGTHEFLDFAELIGADPYVSVNVGSMTPLDAAHWLEYMTSDEKTSLTEERRKNVRERPWKVKYVGVGNELWGCGGSMRPEFAADVTRRYSTFLQAPTGQELVKVASGPSANFGDDGYTGFAEAMMKDSLPGEAFQALSLHYYSWPIGPNGKVANGTGGTAPEISPATGFGEEKWANILRSALGMENAIETITAIMDKYDPDKKVFLAVDEWGAWHKGEPGVNPAFLYQQSSLLDAEVAALTLNILHRHTDRVKMANNSEMVNAIQAIILTDHERMLLTPTYHIFDMYRPFQGALPYPATVLGPQYSFGGHDLQAVDVSVARGQDGKLYLAMVNLDPHRTANVATNLKGRGRGRILTGPTLDTHNTFDAPETVHPVPFSGVTDGGKVAFTLPAKSIAVVAIE